MNPYGAGLIFMNLRAEPATCFSNQLHMGIRRSTSAFTVQNFDDTVWGQSREEIVYKGVFEKFRQNPELRKRLERTGEEVIAECAVKDRIWGIGLFMKDEDRFCVDRWKGQNLLGKILMDVRKDIKQGNYEKKIRQVEEQG